MSGHVIDPDGAPVAGAEVKIGPKERQMRMCGLGPEPVDQRYTTGTTDENGRFLLERPVARSFPLQILALPDTELNLAASKPHFWTPLPGADPLELTLQMRPGHELEINIKGPQDEPVEGVRVLGTYDWNAWIRLTEKTDADGRAILRGIAEGQEISLWAKTYPDAYDYHERNLGQHRPEERSLTFKIEGKTRVIIAAIDAETSEPVAPYRGWLYRMYPENNGRMLMRWDTAPHNQDVVFEKYGNRPRGNLVRSSDGIVRFNSLEPGRYQFETEEVCTESGPLPRRGFVSFEIPATRGEKIVPIPMDEGIVVSGRVVQGTVSGPPVEGAVLIVHTPRGRLNPESLPITTDSEGRFNITGLSKEGEYSITAGADGLRSRKRVALDLSRPRGVRDAANMTLVVEPTATINGRILLNEGAKGKSYVAGYWHDALDPVMSYGSPTSRVETSLNDDGSFVLDNLPAGSGQFWLNSRSFEFIFRSEMSLESGSVKSVQFDLSNLVRISGNVTLNGKKAGGDLIGMNFIDSNAIHNQTFIGYQKNVSRVDYNVRPGPVSFIHSKIKGATRPIYILDSPREREVNLNLQSAPLTLSLIKEESGGGGPSGGKSIDGWIVLEPTDVPKPQPGSDIPEYTQRIRVQRSEVDLGEVFLNDYIIWYEALNGHDVSTKTELQVRNKVPQHVALMLL